MIFGSFVSHLKCNECMRVPCHTESYNFCEQNELKIKSDISKNDKDEQKNR